MIKPKRLVSQSNKLTEARYSLSVGEQRLVLSILSLISPDDAELKEYSIRAAELRKLLGVKHHGMKEQVKKALSQLSTRSITIQKEDGFLIANWFSSAEYKESEGRVIITVDAKLKPYLLQLKEQFTQFNLFTVASFRSAYTIRIYMLLKQYEKIGHREFELSEFRLLLGVDDSKYKQFKELNRCIIKQAQTDFNKKENGEYLSDITFELETIVTSGRAISRLKFIIKKHRVKVIPPPDLPDNEIVDLFIEAGIPKDSVIGWLAEYGEKYLTDKYAYTEHQKREGKLRGSFSGFLVSAVKKDYKSDFQEKQKEEQQAFDEHRDGCQKIYFNFWVQKAKDELISSKTEAILNSLEPDELEEMKALVTKELKEVGMYTSEESKPFIGGMKIRARKKLGSITDEEIEAFRSQVTPPTLKEIEREFDQKTANKMEPYIDEFIKL